MNGKRWRGRHWWEALEQASVCHSGGHSPCASFKADAVPPSQCPDFSLSLVLFFKFPPGDISSPCPKFQFHSELQGPGHFLSW